MSLIDNNNILLREMLGKGKCDVIATTAIILTSGVAICYTETDEKTFK